MFVEFIYALRGRKVPVGAQEAVAVAEALTLGLHDCSLDGFYEVSRALMVHDEKHLDDFDVAFAAHFRGVALESKKIAEELLAWLRDPIKWRELSAEERDAIQKLDLAEVLEQLEKRLREQNERHDGGNRWVGTGGTSPFGSGGQNPSGVSIGGRGGKGGAVLAADARRYRPYRTDLLLDTRQIEVALRKLRVFAHEGADRELDIDATIDATARNVGELEVVTRPPRRSNTRVILMMDVGGSMDPYAHTVSQLFSAAKRATHFKELRTSHFHNCIYGKLWRTEPVLAGAWGPSHAQFLEPVSVKDLMFECAPNHKLVFVGDALMAPYELLGSSGYAGDDGRIPGIEWLRMLKDHFHRAVWLNPENWRGYRGTTIDPIGQIVPMFDLTLEGLGEAVTELLRGGRR